MSSLYMRLYHDMSSGTRHRTQASPFFSLSATHLNSRLSSHAKNARWLLGFSFEYCYFYNIFIKVTLIDVLKTIVNKL